MAISTPDKNKRDLISAMGIFAGCVLAYLLADNLLPKALPPGALVQGLVLGGLQALVAMGLVLVYRSARIINFAQAAIGTLAASLAIVLVAAEGWSYYFAVPVGLLAAVGLGWLIDTTVVRRLTEAPRLIFTVATIGLQQILGAGNLAFPDLFHNISSTTQFHSPFRNSVSFFLSSYRIDGDDIVAIVVVPLALAALFWFFQRTYTGIAIRAAADSSERALLLGIPTRRLSMITWMVAAGLSGVGAILSAPLTSQNIGSLVGPSVLLIPLAAAVLAGMESLPLTVFWAIALTVVQQAVTINFTNGAYTQVIAFAVIMIGMLVQRGRARRVDDGGIGGFVSVREVTSIPEALAKLPEVRIVKAVGLALIALAAIIIPLQFSAANANASVYVLAYALIAVSLVVLTGWAGQISLGQYAFVGIGAAVTGSLIFHFHLNALLAMAAAAIVGAIVACLIGIPALRIPGGLFLAIATMAFAQPVSTWLLSSQYFAWLDPSTVTAPTLFRRFDLHSPYALYELSLIVLACALAMVWNLRRSRIGRVILAVRDNSRGAAAFGIGPMRSKIMAFAISGILAGLAGSIVVLASGGISYGGFDPNTSFTVFMAAVIGGLGSLTGSVLGAVYIQVTQSLPDAWSLLATGTGVLVLLMVFPEGLGGLVFKGRDALIRIVAARRGMENELSNDLPKDSGQDGDPSSLGDDYNPAAHRAALRLKELEEIEIGGRGVGADVSVTNARPAEGRVALITIEDVDVWFGESHILNEVNLGIAQSEVVALLGTNGAGKSTTLKTMAGIVRPSAGRVWFVGTDITDWSPAERVKAGLVTVLGGRGVFPSLSVSDNLRMGTWVARRFLHDELFAEAATDRVLEIFPQLRGRLEQRAELLSGGEQQMLALAQALLCRPKLLLIDELSLGLAPTMVSDILGVVRALSKSGVTVMVVEQSVNVATAISTRAIFIERGRIRFSGPTPALSQQPKMLRSVFLHAASRAQRRLGDRPLRASPAPLWDDSTPGALTGDPNGSYQSSRQPESESDQDQGHSAIAVQALDMVALLSGDAPPPPPPPPPPLPLAAPVPRFDGRRLVDVGQLTETSEDTWPGAPENSQKKSGRYPLIASRTGNSALKLQSPGPDIPAFAIVSASKRYGGVAALIDVSIRVMPGEILGIIGTNGAGKTTLFDLCSGFVKPDSGRVVIHGRDVTDLSPSQRSVLGLGRVFQDARLFPAMTVTECLKTALEQSVPVRDPLASALNLGAVRLSERAVAERVDELIGQFGIGQFRNKFVFELSTGMRRIVELACAVAHRPSVLLLDEPTAGIAQRESEALGELLIGLREQTGAAFVVIEHDVPLVSSIADRLVCMHVGVILAEGATAEVLQDPAVVASYLGTDEMAVGRSGPPTVGAGSI